MGLDSDFHNAQFIGDTFESGRCAFYKKLFLLLQNQDYPYQQVLWQLFIDAEQNCSHLHTSQTETHRIPGWIESLALIPYPSLHLHSSHCGWSGLSSPWVWAWSCDLLWPMEWAYMSVAVPCQVGRPGDASSHMRHSGSCCLFSPGPRDKLRLERATSSGLQTSSEEQVSPASRALNHSCISQTADS